MLWISCLLIGSISCSPIQQDYGSEAAAAAPASSYFMPQQAPALSWRMRRGAGSGFDSSSPLHSVPNPRSGKASQDPTYSSGPGSYSSSPDVYGSTNMAEVSSGGFGFRDEGYNPEAGGHGFAPGASQSAGYDVSAGGSYAGGYDGSAYVGSSSYGFVVAPQDEAGGYGSEAGGYDSAAGYGDENPEPVFSDVSDLEPVYSFSSRSSYQRGRAVFAQTRYTPGEAAPPLMPAARPISRTVSTQSSPARTSSSKGGH